MTLAFLDTETTSLRHDRRAWEIGLVVRRDNGDEIDCSWFVRAVDLDLGEADLGSLKIGRFFDRHPQHNGADRKAMGLFEAAVRPPLVMDEYDVLSQVEEYTRGATIVGAVPNFDTEVLGNRMRAHGICPSWHYHLVDVETLAAGALRKAPPWNFDGLLAEFGLTYDEAERHTALGDARMARDLYDAVLASEQSGG